MIWGGGLACGSPLPGGFEWILMENMKIIKKNGKINKKHEKTLKLNKKASKIEKIMKIKRKS